MNYTINQKFKSDNLMKDMNTTANFILFLYFFIDMLRFFNVIPLTLGNILYVLLGSFSIIYSVVKKGIKAQIPMFSFMFFYMFFGTLGLLLNGNMDIQELLWPFAFMGLAMLFLNFKTNYKLSKSIYYISTYLFLIKIILSGGVNNLNTASSRNTFGIMSLIYFTIYCIASNTSNKKITIYPILLGFLVTIFAVGRSGILTFLILTILFSLLKYDGERYRIRNPIKSLFILIIVLLFLFITYNLFEDFFSKMILNFQRRGLESIRTNIWLDYFKKTITSVKYIFFGTPIKGTYLLDYFSHNLHNSFIMLHAKYGLIPLATVLILILRSAIYFIKTSNLLYLIILLTTIFRMQFDYTNFNAQLDIVLYYFMFFPYIK